ncbi:hypothetical protein TSUD_411360 [Trifolium subterraneum]|uniref:DUF4219 domain-containing protein n=1 Tax=Trifolium subterraneum TaxID=3900 RepID=A0A2Z6PTE6_TRISU|nr:hypothetical protein TSUD_411360 [Trifolium subterraneum]
MDREGGYVTRPPLLDDSNYDIWKARMIAFLKSMDSRTWKAVLKGWEHPKVKDANGADTDVLKPEEEWTTAEDSLALGNSKALNTLFNGVDKNMFRLIKKCEVAKDAWEILKTTQEGTAKVKISRLQNLTRKFENLRMKEDESVHNFYMNVMDFANSFDDLGEKLSDEKIVRKILRSFTKKFDMKVIAMEEAQDISTMKVDELIGSLQTYESSVNERIEKKNKSIAFVSNAEDEDLESDIESTDSVSEAIVLLGRQFNKVLKEMDRILRQNARHLATDMSRSIGNSRKTKIDEKPAQSKGLQCHECEGYGHIRTKCGTYLKKQKKSLNVTWSDEDGSEEEGESEVVKHVTVLTGIKKVNSLTSDLDAANEEIDKLEVDIGRLRKYSEMLNKTGADKLDEILEKNERRPKFIGISYENVNKHRTYNPDLMYTHPKEVPGANMSRKLYGYPQEKQQTEPTPMIQQEWKVKSKNITIKTKVDEEQTENQVTSLIAHTSFRASSKEDCKKQNCVSLSTAEAKYIAAGTRSKFDYGTYIFDETVMHGKSHAVKMPIVFPTLICDAILKQHPGIYTEADVPKRSDSGLSLGYRLFEGTHVVDIVAPFVAHVARQPTGVLTRQQMIADLKEVSKFLGEKKNVLDRVIQVLELEEAAVAGGEEGPSNTYVSSNVPDTDAGGDTEVLEEQSANSYSV